MAPCHKFLFAAMCWEEDIGNWEVKSPWYRSKEILYNDIGHSWFMTKVGKAIARTVIVRRVVLVDYEKLIDPWVYHGEHLHQFQ